MQGGAAGRAEAAPPRSRACRLENYCATAVVIGACTAGTNKEPLNTTPAGGGMPYDWDYAGTCL